jgi:two-component system chemotaxis sensor kinase CheA
VISSLAESFREELVTLLEALETSLLGLDERPGQEQLDEVFRAAHNIKSATAMMGLRAAAETAHHLETKLDEMRSGRRSVDRATVTRLLDDLDRLRVQVRSPSAGGEEAVPPAPATRRFRVLLSMAHDAPDAALDPLALLFAIADFGTVVSSRTDETRLPALEELDPEAMYLRFELVLETSVTLDDLRSAFLFAEDRIDLELSELPAEGRLAGPDRAENAGEGRRPEAETVVVGVRRIDALVELAAELAIATTRLDQLRAQGVATSDGRIEAACGELRRLSSRVQEAAMSMRLVPMASTFALLRRYIRDQSLRLGKDVVVDVRGAQTELDKSVAERLFDPLKHLVRNALDHGIEPPAARLAAGKPAAGRLTLSARQGQGEVVLVVEDDGRGLDFGRIREIAVQRGVLAPDEPASDAALTQALFLPGFTTSAEVGELSGRGIGLDVVRRNVLELGGELHVEGGPGRGCRVSLTVPMTVAMLEGIVVRCAEEQIVIPVDDVRQLVRPGAGQSARLPDGQEVLRLPDGPVPLVRPGALLGLDTAAARGGVAVLVGAPAGVMALQVDEIVSHEQIMLKSLPRSLRLSDPILGAAVLGDGRVALVLDVNKITAGEREIEPVSAMAP